MPLSLLIAKLALVPIAGAQADPDEVVRLSNDLLQSASTVQGSYTLTSGNGEATEIQFALDKPNSLVFRSGSKVEVFDGKDHTIAMTDRRTYERRNVFVYGTPFLIGYQNFIKSEIDGRKTRLMTYGPATFVEVAGRRYVRHTSGSGDRTITVDIDPETKLPARWRWQTESGTYQAVFGNVVLNQPIPNSAFDVPALTAGYALVPTVEERTLPAVGTMGTNIQGRTVQGRDFDLLATAASRRATVLAFVNPNDANSANAALGIRNIVGNRRDVEVVYVSSVANREATQRFLKSVRISNPCLVGEPANGAISGYGVRLYPTVVVLDATGKVTSRMLGFDETAFTSAIAATPALSGTAN